MMELRMYGMKNHDCHVFIQILIPIAPREMLPEHAWSTLTEVSLLFQSICSTTLDVHKLHELENTVATILCNLAKIFPPAFFDSMEHLVVHLPYEALVGGPVQYRWMYPFERFLRELKKKVKNKAHVEASIVEAYILEEIGLFTSQHFDSGVQSKRTMARRNDECTNNDHGIQVSIFNYLVELVVPQRKDSSLDQNAGTLRSQVRQTDDDNEDDDEDSFEDDNTDDDEYELT
ncbi:UNVERIFIED_CONTAM: hypothetical protein Slati_3889000 [Sesamum latifolium]|uniref:DUF4218 domain-containing protein n=1 Tax=Sesamum latifolium TaxID=2727402 RepID=A0AAW2TQA4_9LAMI